MKVINNKEYDYITSNLVYPLDKGYRLICKIDQEWLKYELQKLQASRIGNKYVINIDGKLYYQHDNDTWLIEKKESTQD